jgi:hypothetical protein
MKWHFHASGMNLTGSYPFQQRNYFPSFFPGLIKAEPVPEQGPDRFRAAPYFHRVFVLVRKILRAGNEPELPEDMLHDRPGHKIGRAHV